MKNEMNTLTKERGVDINVADMPLLDTRPNKDFISTFISGLIMQILSIVSNAELNNIKQRQAAGIAPAKAQDVRYGRLAKMPLGNSTAIVKRWEHGQLTFSKVLKQTGLKQTTFYNGLKEFRRREMN